MHRFSPVVISTPNTHSPQPLFRICPAEEWEATRASAAYLGSDLDRRDGFIHLSSGQQVLETLQTHFDGMPDLVVLKIDPSRFGDALRWEPSRGGELFPHLYGALPISAILQAIQVPQDDHDRRRLFLELQESGSGPGRKSSGR